MTPPESKTHRIAILRQDNGELQEDIVHRAAVEPLIPGDSPAVEISSYGDPDADGEDSFPASDPPSHWAGSEDDDTAVGARRAAARIVDTLPVEDVEGRPSLAAPIPGRLTRPPRPPHPH
ncbi:MAG TPA: hypothetical protein VG412_03015 [Acidimicrobiales bacterium]|nr:hypothetical protein [Acidimicrobiales bacterium]